MDLYSYQPSKRARYDRSVIGGPVRYLFQEVRLEQYMTWTEATPILPGARLVDWQIAEAVQGYSPILILRWEILETVAPPGVPEVG